MIVRKPPQLPFLSPGHVFMPSYPMWLWSVVTSGVTLTLFDRLKKVGGMAHYSLPIREPDKPSTTLYAAPAIFSLVQMFSENGSNKQHLEAQVYGGSRNLQGTRQHMPIHEKNVEVGCEILERLQIHIVGIEIGGYRPRKIGFHTGTGETIVAKVNKVRPADWVLPSA